MPNKRKKGKRVVGFYASEDEATAILKAAKAEGKTVSDWLRSLIPSETITQLPKSGSTSKKETHVKGRFVLIDEDRLRELFRETHGLQDAAPDESAKRRS